MDFDLTESQSALRDEVRTFAEETIEPRAAALDANEEYPADVMAELGERRLTGLTLPERFGGRDEGWVELAVVVEELSAAMMPVASALALHHGVAAVLDRFGTDEQRERFLPEMARFETVCALGLSEENAGSDKLAMETRAEHDGNEWVIDGHKRWVTNFLDADYVLTYAKTGPDADAPHSVSAFLVPAEEFEVETVWDTLGARAVKSPKVTLSGVRVPDEAMVGEEGEAYVRRGEVPNGVNLPARGVGIARAALAETREYVRDRRQFGQSVGDFQGVRWRLAEMAQRVDAARLLTFRAAHRADEGGDVARELSMAKVYATEAAVDTASDAMDLHGGIGYTTERPVERYLRDAKLLTVAGGPNDLHRNTVGERVLEG
ncbi:acyl-CoA dehydrogenase family protein [Halomarina litorea]|uniref:acyl-CoA dehydrogenase family protein n=1 Tax=Halomarina litorea TaxID=2961595 RepID=UPI0020C3E127|nr:acyl-CoA dehydrogenase family protein [Halomarina sp. BCD28]